MGVDIHVPKKDPTQRIMAMLEWFEAEAGKERSIITDAEGYVREVTRPALDQAQQAFHARMHELDRIGNSAGQREFIPGGDKRVAPAMRVFAECIMTARSIAMGERPKERFERLNVDPKTRAMLEGDGSTGLGVVVPVETMHDIIRYKGPKSIVEHLAQRIEMTTDVMTVGIETGIGQAYWNGENVTSTASDVTTRAKAQAQLKCETVQVERVVSRELDEDAAVALAQYLTETSMTALDIAVDLAGFQGQASGAADPFKGIIKTLEDDATGQIVTLSAGKTTFNGLLTTTGGAYDALVDTEMLVEEEALSQLNLVMRKQGFGVARKIKDNDGQPIWTRQWGNGLPGMGERPVPSALRATTVLDNPCYISTQMPADGANKTIAIFGDWSMFLYGDRGKMFVEWDMSLERRKRLASLFIGKRVAMLIAKPTAFSIIKTAAA